MEKQNSKLTELYVDTNDNKQTIDSQYADCEHVFYDPKKVKEHKKKAKTSDDSALMQSKTSKQRLKTGAKTKSKSVSGALYDSAGGRDSREKFSPGKRRTATKRKRIAKSHGPDFESYAVVPRKTNDASQRRSSGESERDVTAATSTNAAVVYSRCDFCLLTSEVNRLGEPEELLFCKDCQAKAHPSCMEYSSELARRARLSPWQCIDCKTCCLCLDAGDPDAMLFCDSCDKGYHMKCHIPPVLEKPTGKWVCNRCMVETATVPSAATSAATSADVTEENDDKTIVNGSVNGDSSSPQPSVTPPPPPPLESPVEFTDRLYHPPPNVNTGSSMTRALMMILPSFRRFVDQPVPDPAPWSVDDVVSFITDIGFPEESLIFKEQEIDGKSLLLLKRSDVLEGLPIKLGPAVKIFAHIQRLQTKGNLII